MITHETREKWIKKIETIFEACEVGQCELNEWETDFFNSIYDQVINQNRDLSHKQTKILNRLYEKIG